MRFLPMAFCSFSTPSSPSITVIRLFSAEAVINSVKFIFACSAFRLIALWSLSLKRIATILVLFLVLFTSLSATVGLLK